MSYTDDTSDQEWVESKPNKKSIKEEANSLGGPGESGGNKPKYMQKFREKWLNIFHPWLARCDDDLNKPFCRACQCRLNCNRCHLQRHAITFKHVRNLEILVSKGESAAQENLSIRQERSKYYQQRKKLNVMHDMESAMDTAEEYTEDTAANVEGNFQFVQTENAPSHQYSDEPPMKQEVITSGGQNFDKQKYKQRTTLRSATKRPMVPVKKDGNKLLMQIKKGKNDLLDSFKEFIGSSTGRSVSHSPVRERNHVDLFFESVSSSVKALTPKLIAEAKMRVSQLICELELRALTESDGARNETIRATRPLVVTPEAANTYVVNSQPHQDQEGSS